MTARRLHGFTLVEILIVIGLIGILLGLMILNTERARSQARDEQRKVDLELIRAGLEELYGDCGIYLSNHTFDCRAGYITESCWPVGPSPVTGAAWVYANPAYGKQACSPSNVYIEKIPLDPHHPNKRYRYQAFSGSTGISYILCAALENPPTPPMDSSKLAQCGGACGSLECNYYIEDTH